MKIKHMKRIIAFLLRASLSTGICVSGMAAEKDSSAIETDRKRLRTLWGAQQNLYLRPVC